jgi:ureidoglycolate hydrolase
MNSQTSQSIAVPVRPLDPDVFRPLGQVLRIPEDGSRRPTLQNESFKFYGGLGLVAVKDTFEFGVCTFKRRHLETRQLEQHAQTPELLYAIDGDFIMPVAPIKRARGLARPDLARLQAILVRQGEGVIFKDGIWHWAPFPVKKSSSVLVGFKAGTAKRDLIIRDLGCTLVMTRE